jgi:hypothetical protein
VRRAEDQAKWSGLRVELPYPGRWVHHRAAFRRKLIPLLRKSLLCLPKTPSGPAQPLQGPYHNVTCPERNT